MALVYICLCWPPSHPALQQAGEEEDGDDDEEEAAANAGRHAAAAARNEAAALREELAQARQALLELRAQLKESVGTAEVWRGSLGRHAAPPWPAAAAAAGKVHSARRVPCAQPPRPASGC